MSNTAEELATTVSGLLGVEECVHHEAPPMEEDIDEDIRCMVASMCGGGGDGVISSSMKEATRPREVGKQVGITSWALFQIITFFAAGPGKKSKEEAKPTHQVRFRTLFKFCLFYGCLLEQESWCC